MQVLVQVQVQVQMQMKMFCSSSVTWHMAHEDGLAGLPGAGNGVVLDGRPFLQRRVEPSGL